MIALIIEKNKTDFGMHTVRLMAVEECWILKK